MLIKQRTIASFARKNFFDDSKVTNLLVDISPPIIQSTSATSGNELDVLFDEPLDKTSSETTSNYTTNNLICAPLTALLDTNDNALVHLRFNSNFAGTPNSQLW